MKQYFRFLLVLIAMVALALACYRFGVERTNEQKFTQLNTGTLESNGVRTRIRVIASNTLSQFTSDLLLTPGGF